jgi:8-oxo-dGTP pyrophosphatase MutT (NUDIX family)
MKVRSLFKIMPSWSYLKSLPKKRMGAGVLLFDNQKRLLIVKPSYKPGWIIPGGVIEKNESPLAAVLRETEEEIGLRLKNIKFVGLDYISANQKEDENLQFIFFGGTLALPQINRIQLQDSELRAFKFTNITDAKKLLSPKISRRLPYCLDAIQKKSSVYLHDGVPPRL